MRDRQEEKPDRIGFPRLRLHDIRRIFVDFKRIIRTCSHGTVQCLRCAHMDRTTKRVNFNSCEWFYHLPMQRACTTLLNLITKNISVGRRTPAHRRLFCRQSFCRGHLQGSRLNISILGSKQIRNSTSFSLHLDHFPCIIQPRL